MKSLQMQPTFTLDFSVSRQEALSRIRTALQDRDLVNHAVAAGNCVDYAIAREDQAFWSPHLSVQFSDTELGCQLLGRFSPRPEIWTLFMAIDAAALIATFASLIYAYVQWSLGDEPWAGLVAPAGLLIIGGLHVASLIGQRLSSSQMKLLRKRLDDTLQIAFSDQEPTAP